MQKFTAWSNYDDPNPALWLHMVGDASYGLACWYFIFDKSTNPRLLPMYKKPPSAARTVVTNSALEEFSGYYQMQNPSSFVLIQEQRKPPDKEILITFANNDSPTFLEFDEEKKMSFNDRQLKIEDYFIELNFKGLFKAPKGRTTNSLHEFDGTIDNTQVSGNSQFNIIPLISIGGVQSPFTVFSDGDNNRLEIITPNKIKYNELDPTSDFLYIPWTQTLVFPTGRQDKFTVCNFSIDVDVKTNPEINIVCLVYVFNTGNPITFYKLTAQ